MHALRLARSVPTAAALRAAATPAQRRCLATATANHVEVASSSSSSGNAGTATSTSSTRVAPIPLSNIEAQWAKMSADEKVSVHEQLEVVQQKDWKELSLDEKKAAYYVAFGPHGPRTPSSQPGDTFKIAAATTLLVGAAGVLFYTLHHFAAPPPKTLTKEWQEASNERALEMKINPITGISSEGYKGKGFVQE
ncbi:hypothetical protein GALMADRAFT_256153 [Galerina marginata CBS 339.88]|uniref:Cytochrome c oxidase subunit IV n=1 Tax=Galerina marginata (strain CBS 339.88) TaxID=685588 RepID=A0A067SEI0_GALM3|nr:hypothetical protein GALMADRAFT_256153 [Galerina marginata CBS 339.88]